MTSFQNNYNPSRWQRVKRPVAKNAGNAIACTKAEEVRSRIRKGEKELIYCCMRADSERFYCLHISCEGNSLNVWMEDASTALEEHDLLQDFYQLLVEVFDNFQVYYLLQGKDINRKVLRDFHEESDDESSPLVIFENYSTSFAMAILFLP
jgi:hypothetical protein